jgi:hypothetical protein
MSDEFDFGFTAVDEEELGLSVPTPPPAPVANPELLAIKTQIEALQSGAVTREECKAKLQAVERMILPLLQNLMKNPDKPYIKWENRAEKIAAQIDKITAITRSYGV